MKQTYLKITWKFSHKSYSTILEKLDAYMVILQIPESTFVFKEKWEQNSSM